MMSNRENESVKKAEIGMLESELEKIRKRSKKLKLIRSTLYSLVVVAAVAVLVAVLFMPVLRIYGSSMEPTLNEREIIVSVKGTDIKRGEIVGFYYGSKLLIKRCIAKERQWVNIDEEGNVYVDGVMIDEPYIEKKALGNCNIEFPYQVPDNSIFVLGDHRDVSIDSRNTSVGCILVDDIVGKIVFRVWPLSRFGTVK